MGLIVNIFFDFFNKFGTILVMKNAIIVIILSFLLSCSRQQYYYARTEFLMDTYVTIKLPDETAIDRAFDYMRSLEQEVNLFTREINTASVGKSLCVPSDILELVEQSIEIGDTSNGAFDITVGELVQLWGFFSETSPIHPPPDEAIQAILEKIGYKYLVLNGKSLKKERDFKVDFGGIAKGFIIRQTARFIRSQGVKSGLIDAGGDIVCIGSKRGVSWKIGIQHPRQAGEIMALLKLKDVSVVTSGDYERYFIYGDTRYHHVISPFTGYPSRNAISVTIIGPDAMTADALATALMVLPAEQVESFFKKYRDYSAFLIYEEQGKGLKYVYLNDFEKYLHKKI